jgi:anti-sigma factor RsiW
MNCDDVRIRLDARLDGELAAGEAAEVDAHVERCADCKALREQRSALRQALQRDLPRFAAPEALRRDLMRSSREAPNGGERATRRMSRQWGLALAASLALVAVGTWQLATARAHAALFTQTVLESHVRSLIGEHLTDVASSDQHTVKPWFNGRLDFSPPVYDFAGRGYPLLGGRLEYLGERQVAALVYQRRKHIINVFLWPADAAMAGGPANVSRHGYNLLHWNRPDFTYWVVSDLGEPELKEFAWLLQQADSAAGAPR